MLTPFYGEPVELYTLINAFFLYSFIGWVMECIVIRIQNGNWENRGFAKTPFCIIYGFGAMMGYALLSPLSHNYFLLYLVGALGATLFEYLTARIMLRLFGAFWWDYSRRPFNYRGILCLESTLGWGFLILFLFTFLHRAIFSLVGQLPMELSMALAVLLPVVYGMDFLINLFRSLNETRRARGQQPLSLAFLSIRRM